MLSWSLIWHRPISPIFVPRSLFKVIKDFCLLEVERVKTYASGPGPLFLQNPLTLWISVKTLLKFHLNYQRFVFIYNSLPPKNFCHPFSLKRILCRWCVWEEVEKIHQNTFPGHTLHAGFFIESFIHIGLTTSQDSQKQCHQMKKGKFFNHYLFRVDTEDREFLEICENRKSAKSKEWYFFPFFSTNKAFLKSEIGRGNCSPLQLVPRVKI